MWEDDNDRARIIHVNHETKSLKFISFEPDEIILSVFGSKRTFIFETNKGDLWNTIAGAKESKFKIPFPSGKKVASIT
ncbi:hypothetical protein HOG98_04465 [bacterium]|nr:hypothetical protein [bacterium]